MRFGYVRRFLHLTIYSIAQHMLSPNHPPSTGIRLWDADRCVFGVLMLARSLGFDWLLAGTTGLADLCLGSSLCG